MQTQTIGVAMSGGADSAATALILKESGCRVFGITAVMMVSDSTSAMPEYVERARFQALKIGIDHHVVNVQRQFKEMVIETFVASYLSGRTPSPCILCNRFIKFGILADEVGALGGDKIATGHYARLVDAPDGSCGLARGVDVDKDQSYFLAMLTREQLGRAVFPLGEMTKKDAGRLLIGKDLDQSAGKESQDICFIGDRQHGHWIDEECGLAPEGGDIEDTAGNKLGRHNGIHHFTVGQRKGLGISSRHPLYIVAIDPARNVVVVGPREEVMGRSISVSGINWIGRGLMDDAFKCRIQIRYRHQPAEGVVTLRREGRVEVEFKESQFGITPGQLAVFYDGDQVIGGGWIEAWNR